MDIFFTLFRELNFYYVDETDPDELIEKGIHGMLKSLDPYTTYIPESDMADFKFMTTGQYGGIGALIRKSGDYIIISDPYKNFPAQKAGLRAGDKIVKINGKNAKKKDVGDISDLLKGKPGTELEVEIDRPGVDKNFAVQIIREKITISGVPFSGLVDESVGYIRITSFTSNVYNDVKEALVTLKENGATSLVVDLRSNPGGLLNEAVKIMSLFVAKSEEIVSTRGKIKQYDSQYKTTNNPVDTEIPVAILVNRGSASASEIVAGAFQDLDRGVIVGQRTFGKGLVQQTRPLSYNTQLKVTTAKYYIPSGRCIQALDYSNRNDDGSVGHVPDSLITEYKTKNGRSVYDGGGIKPDFKIEIEPYGKISISLYAKNIIFDYATHFVINNSSISAVENFVISDSIYDDFKLFIKDKDYDYKTQSSEKFEELIRIAKREKYYSLAKEEFEILEGKLAHDKNKDLETFKDEIKTMLYEEICGRYYFQAGSIEATLKNDPQLDKAIEILMDKQMQAKILEGTFKQDSTILAKH
ncbi:S41 family peptidase [Bacteroidales bacterium]|nr:S41 family peptidase [Bacteroidales bacterium]